MSLNAGTIKSLEELDAELEEKEQYISRIWWCWQCKMNIHTYMSAILWQRAATSFRCCSQTSCRCRAMAAFSVNRRSSSNCKFWRWMAVEAAFSLDEYRAINNLFSRCMHAIGDSSHLVLFFCSPVNTRVTHELLHHLWKMVTQVYSRNHHIHPNLMFPYI